MRIRIFVIPIFVFIGYSACAQWSLQVSPTQGSINDIHFNSNNAGFISSGYGLYRTLDGGSSWIYPTLSGSQLELEILTNTFFNDIYFVDNQKGFVVGGGFFNAYDIIARTLDGGATWSLVYYTPVEGSLFRESMNSITFVNQMIGFAVGGHGRVVKTTDGGATWTDINLSTTQDLSNVYFRDSQVGFIAGKHALLKTVNGGSTWSAINPSAYQINDLHFYDANNGVASTTEGVLLKTADGGSTWTEDALLKFDYPLTKIEFSGNTGYVLANNALYQTFILKTSDNGATWGIQDFPDGYGMYALHATSSGNVWAGGYAGKLYNTANGGGEVLPIAAFSVSAPRLCENQTYTFQNHGYGQYAYEWRVDGVLRATSYNYTTNLTYGEHTIELTAINGTQRGTKAVVYHVEADASFTLPLDVAFTDGICTGTSVTIRVREYEWGDYELYMNGEMVNGKVENYPYHYFQTPALTQTTTFSVKATRSNSCQTFENTKEITVNVHPYPSTGSALSVLHPDLCNEGQTSVQISNSKANVRYDLYYTKNDWVPITSVSGNGGNAMLNTPFLTDTAQYLVKASIVDGACINWFDDTVRVNVEHVTASFELSLINTPAGEPVTVTNNSFGASNFNWNFSAASNPQTSTLPQPATITFTGSGTQTVSLSVSSESGCSDSAERTITLYDPSMLDASCWATEITYNLPDFFTPTKEFLNVETTPDGDIIVAGVNPGNVDFKSESLGTFELHANNDGATFLARYSSQGVLKWIIPDLAVISPLVSRIAVSSDGSIYVCGATSADAVFHSANGTIVRKSISDSTPSRHFIIKYSPQGNIIWAKSFEELQIPIEWHYVYGLDTDAEGNLYVANDRVSKITSEGIHLWTSEKFLEPGSADYEKGQFALAGDGSWYFLKRSYPTMKLSRYSKEGNLEWNSDIGATSGWGIGQSYVGADNAGNLFFVYTDVGKANLQLPDATINSDPSSLWIIKFAPDGSIVWVNKAPEIVTAHDVEFSRNGTLNLILTLYPWQTPDLKTSLQSQDGNIVDLNFAGYPPYLVTYDSEGVILRSRVIRDAAGQTTCIMYNVDMAAHDSEVYGIGFANCESIINGDIIYDDLDSDFTTVYLAKFALECNNITQKMDVSITDTQQDQFCTGSTIEVNYQLHNSYVTNQPKLFNVYLSDELGFTNRTRSALIGTLESANSSGTIQGVIPDNIVWGVDYYIRVVVDSDPELYSTVVPVGKYLSGDFTPDFNYDLQDLNINLSATGRPGVHYEWAIVNNQTGEVETISGDPQAAGRIQYRVPETGNYTVYLTVLDACGHQGTTEKGPLYVVCEDSGTDFTYAIDKKTVTFTAIVNPDRTSSFQWTFSDGTTSSEKNPVHTFENYGSVGATLTTTNECGIAVSARTIELTCPSIDPKITYVQENKIVTFTHAGVSALPAESSYLWSFGDGSTSTQLNPQHTYASVGSYNVSLSETNECSSKTVWVTVVVTCPRPTLAFTPSSINMEASFTSSFQHATLTHWDFGDGTTTETSNTILNHAYTAIGTYQVCMSASNECGTEQLCKSVEIVCPVPKAKFDFEVTSGLIVTFTNQSVNYSSLLWSFGGDAQSTEESPVREFDPGVYEVCLEVENTCGSTTACQEVVVVLTNRELELSKSVLTYPNPVSDNLVIRAEQDQINGVEAVTVLGARVYHESLSAPTNEVIINTKNWTSGEYIMIITIGGSKVTRKIFKQ